MSKKYFVISAYLDNFTTIDGIPSRLENGRYGRFTGRDPYLAARKAVRSIYEYLAKYMNLEPTHIYVVIGKDGDDVGKLYLGFLADRETDIRMQTGTGKIINFRHRTKALPVNKAHYDKWGRQDLVEYVINDYENRRYIAQEQDYRQNLLNLD